MESRARTREEQAAAREDVRMHQGTRRSARPGHALRITNSEKSSEEKKLIVKVSCFLVKIIIIIIWRCKRRVWEHGPRECLKFLRSRILPVYYIKVSFFYIF